MGDGLGDWMKGGLDDRIENVFFCDWMENGLHDRMEDGLGD